MDADRWPMRLEDLTCEALTAALRQGGTLASGRVAEFEVSPLRYVGQTSKLSRIDLSYAGDASSAPRSAIVKLPSDHPSTRALAAEYGSYLREVRFYQTFGGDPSLPLPQTYLADFDAATGGFILLLEDLSRGRPGSVYQDALADVRTGLEHLAKLHAKYWGDRNLDAYPWLRRQNDQAILGMLGAKWGPVLHKARNEFGDSISDYTWSVAETWAREWEIFRRYRSSDAHTLIHGDTHSNQMIFATRAQPRFALLDWQDAGKGWAALDVARLLAMGLNTETRRTHEKDLVLRYLDSLANLGVADREIDRFWFQIRLSNLWNVQMNFMAAIRTETTNLESVVGALKIDWREALLGRIDAAMQDWDTGDALVRVLAEARHQ